MPRRDDLESILIIGAGPIVIGQACEFDYSGTQACKALKEEGYRVILVNSNPATIMTDPASADAIYIEPIHWRTVAAIIEKEKPSALLPTMGGQTALNCALDLVREGVLEQHGVELIAASREAIDMAEDRELFRHAMKDIGLATPRAGTAHSLEEAWAVQEEVGFPTIVRPSFTLGGSGGGIAYNREEFEDIVTRGIDQSPTGEVLVEESVIGWKEFEMEVVRDRNDNCIIICSIENVDPMGIHTGDSITVAPAQTLTDKEYQRMRDASIAVLRKIGVDTGGSNVQFALSPKDGRLLVIEMNPRVSRSSALASKATGFPIAKVAAKLAIGYTLDELKNEITGGATPASFEPTIDYVVTKIPRFTFEKFPQAADRLTTQMKSVGEVMAIGRTFQESLQKAMRGLEIGVDGFNPVMSKVEGEEDWAKLRHELKMAGSRRLWYVGDAFRFGLSLDEVQSLTNIDRWFLVQIQEIVALEKRIAEEGPGILVASELRPLKRKGFSDRRIADLIGVKEKIVRTARYKENVRPVFKRVDSCAAEFASATPYLYSTYEEYCEADPTDREKIMILGGGPNRIGQGIEFDYCCVHASFALKEIGFETIMVNCNPETVSTDYDTSDRLYFEPVTLEDVLEIVHKEKPKGVIVTYGGQTPLKLARALEEAGVPIIGTSPDSIDLAEDRERFQQLVHKLKLKQPPNRTARNADEAVAMAKEVGYPLIVRPSYVLGGRAMEIVHGEDELRDYVERAVSVSNDSPILLDRFLDLAVEVDVDAIADGEEVIVAGHHGARRAGRHSLRRLRVLVAAVQPEPGDAAEVDRSSAPDGAGAQGQRDHEHAVRDPERRNLRARSEPARVANDTVRVEGDRPAAREDRREGDGRDDVQAAGRVGRRPAAVLLGQGVGVSVHQVPRRRSDPRSGDEIDGRGDGHRTHFRRGVREGADRVGRRAAAARARVHQRPRPRQAGRRRARQDAGCARLRDRRDRRHRAGARRRRRAVPTREQGSRRPPARRRHDQEPRALADRQYDRRQAGDSRVALDSRRGGALQGHLLHDAGRREGDLRRDRPYR